MANQRPTKFDVDTNTTWNINGIAAGVLIRALTAYRQELTARIYNRRIAGNNRPGDLEEEVSEIEDMIEYVEYHCDELIDLEQERRDPL
jgi:hypothetical protein